MNWIISANGSMYDHAGAFHKFGFVDWRQNVKYELGDAVYIYCTRPLMKVMYKTIVTRTSISPQDIVNDKIFWTDVAEYQKSQSGYFSRLELVAETNNQYLGLSYLLKNGLKAAPQGPVKLSDELASYMNHYFSTNSEPMFPESEGLDNLFEGSKMQVFVNRYERSPIAREQCILYHGCKCFVCDMNFEETYGELGKNFIHVHHIVPLSKINSKYKVSYQTDLIPVCPNCHSMLHRKIGDSYLMPQELKELLHRKRKY